MVSHASYNDDEDCINVKTLTSLTKGHIFIGHTLFKNQGSVSVSHYIHTLIDFDLKQLYTVSRSSGTIEMGQILENSILLTVVVLFQSKI